MWRRRDTTCACRHDTDTIMTSPHCGEAQKSIFNHSTSLESDRAQVVLRAELLLHYKKRLLTK